MHVFTYSFIYYLSFYEPAEPISVSRGWVGYPVTRPVHMSSKSYSKQLIPLKTVKKQV